MPLLSIAIGTGLVLLFSNFNFFGFFSSFELMFNYTFFGRCTEFFVGITLAVVYKNNLLKKFRYCTYSGIVAIVICIFLLMMCKGDLEFGIRHPMGKLVNNLILPLFGISTLYYGLLKEDTLISRLLSSKLFILLGKSSYIFYLIHMGIFSSLLPMLGLKGSLFSYLMNFVIINIISIVLYKYLEEPINNFIRKLNTSRQKAVLYK